MTLIPYTKTLAISPMDHEVIERILEKVRKRFQSVRVDVTHVDLGNEESYGVWMFYLRLTDGHVSCERAVSIEAAHRFLSEPAFVDSIVSSLLYPFAREKYLIKQPGE